MIKVMFELRLLVYDRMDKLDKKMTSMNGLLDSQEHDDDKPLMTVHEELDHINEKLDLIVNQRGSFAMDDAREAFARESNGSIDGKEKGEYESEVGSSQAFP